MNDKIIEIEVSEKITEEDLALGEDCLELYFIELFESYLEEELNNMDLDIEFVIDDKEYNSSSIKDDYFLGSDLQLPDKIDIEPDVLNQI